MVRQMKEQIEIRKYDTYFVTHGFGTIAALKYIEGLIIILKDCLVLQVSKKMPMILMRMST